MNTVELRMPSLAERTDDLDLLINHFVQVFGKKYNKDKVRIDGPTINKLKKYPWPGNIRELENAIERALVLCSGDEIRPADLGIAVQPAGPAAAGDVLSLADLEARHIQHVLELVEGNKTRACELLGIPRASLYNKLKRLESA